MWQLVVGYVAGGASALLFIRVMNQKLREQRTHYERQLGEANKHVVDLTCKDAYRQGRDHESDAQAKYRAGLRRENEELRASMAELRRELNLESTFAHRLATEGKAKMIIR